MDNTVFTVEQITRLIQPIAAKYNLEKVYLFGSYARGEAGPASEIDLCVDPGELNGFFAPGALYADLEESLNKRLDLIPSNALKYNSDTVFLERLQKERLLIYSRANQ